MPEEITITRAIQFAIATEETGAKAYCKLAERFSEQEEISAAFSLLAKDEAAHKAQFQNALDQAPPEAVGAATDENSSFLGAMAMSEFFQGDEGLMGKLEKARDLQEALLCVLNFEKATYGYYRAVRDVLGESEALDRIIQAEKGHIIRLMNYLLTDEKFKGLRDVL
ncbi:MAG: hypothetical protein HQ582_06090 [Planctomycetes bacterium]|nr:hypothetical protein [Planctomycetota bacterium]